METAATAAGEELAVLWTGMIVTGLTAVDMACSDVEYFVVPFSVYV